MTDLTTRGSGTRERILAALPATRPVLAMTLGLDVSTIFGAVEALHGAKLIHISGWPRRAGRGPIAPMYTAGQGVDAKKPPVLRPAKNGGPIARRHALQNRADILAALPGTRAELAERTGLSIMTIGNHLNKMPVYVERMQRTGLRGSWAAVWAVTL